MPVEIILSAEQYARAMEEAERRQAVNVAKGLRGRNNAPSKGEASTELHRLGCTGELAVAIFLGMEDQVFTEQYARAGTSDLPGIEVKTRKKHGYDLLIQLKDDTSKLFVLTTCDRELDPRRVLITGWTYGEPVMRKEHVREFVRGRPCYAVPNPLLQPIETLKEELHQPVGPSRVLGPEDAWLSEEGEDLLLNFNPKLLDELGWKTEDSLEWVVDVEFGSCRLVNLSKRDRNG